jgi:hypothetical protein
MQELCQETGGVLCFIWFMGLTKQQQLELYRANGTAGLTLGVMYGIKRLVKGKVKRLTKKQNRRKNRKELKPPKIFYGYNTNK